eukprot:COSAG06_NODE_20888_length_777_cov_1.628319_2_plen_29_part_01
MRRTVFLQEAQKAGKMSRFSPPPPPTLFG